MRKLEVGVQSGNWYNEATPEESIGFIRNCGFEGIDYNINNVFTATFDAEKLTSFFDQSLEDIFAYYAPMKKALEFYDVNISQAHALFPIYYPGQDEKNEYLIKVTEKMIAACEYLNCKAIVVHPWSGVNVSKDEEKEINLNVYRRLMPAARKHGVKICLENMFLSYNGKLFEGACADADEVCWYIDTLNAEAGEDIFGYCFDIGHANVCSKNIYQFVKTLGKRLTVLHLHDNNGVADSHMIPYTQRDKSGYHSTIDWDKFLQALKEIGYEGPIAFETFKGIDALPQTLQGDGLKFVAAIGKYFRSCVE